MKKSTLCSSFPGIFVWLAISASAQEIIREPQYVKDSISIVRELDENRWLAANTYYGLTQFTQLSEDASESQILQYPEWFDLCDFELLDRRYAFYCGEGRNGAIMGFFDASEMSSCPMFNDCAYLGSRTQLRRLKKMDVYVDGDMKVHVVMTAVTTNGRSRMVEAVCAYPPGGGWTFYTATDNNFEDIVFDDVAATGKKIAFTARDGTNGIVYSFTKNPGSTIFNSTTTGRYQYSYTVNDTLLVKTCKDDSIVTATHSVGTSMVHLTTFDLTHEPFPHVATCAIPFSEPDQYITLRDIVFHPWENSTNVLVHASDPSAGKSYIVPVNAAAASLGGIANGHQYKYNSLAAIISLQATPQLLLCSGHPTFWANVLRVYRHRPNTWQNCTEKCEFKVGNIGINLTPNSFTASTMNYSVEEQLIRGICYKRPEDNYCE